MNTQDPVTGAVTPTWQLFAEVWGAVEPLSAREFRESQANQSEISARVTIRHLPGVTAAMRVVHRGQTYNIRGVLSDRDSGIEYLTLPVSVGVNEGD